MKSFRTAEFVSPQHPDKLCDRISDAILDAHLALDPLARVAAETMGGHGQVFVIGEITSSAKVEIEPIVKRIAGDNVIVQTNLVLQSPEIARGVDTGGAGDQGIMIGYATSETAEMLPLEYVLARRLNQYLFKKYGTDGKTQVTLLDDKIREVVASSQKSRQAELAQDVTEWLHSDDLASDKISSELRILANPAGDWGLGGFEADTGLTGRKLIVDNYSPRIPIGGGAFSGKDSSKVDRSAAYIARKIAVDYLKKHQCKEVLVRLAYAIGYDQPVEATVLLDGVAQTISGYDLSPNGIIKQLDLRRPIYEDLATNGYFGRSNLPWEK